MSIYCKIELISNAFKRLYECILIYLEDQKYSEPVTSERQQYPTSVDYQLTISSMVYSITDTTHTQSSAHKQPRKFKACSCVLKSLINTAVCVNLKRFKICHLGVTRDDVLVVMFVFSLDDDSRNLLNVAAGSEPMITFITEHDGRWQIRCLTGRRQR